ncbi:hypothetical protein N9Y17_01650, partial [Gammaproteobacteria bacterium]|nr:hypothetical protein [Gammaproteobacteria bacterium]
MNKFQSNQRVGAFVLIKSSKIMDRAKGSKLPNSRIQRLIGNNRFKEQDITSHFIKMRELQFDQDNGFLCTVTKKKKIIDPDNSSRLTNSRIKKLLGEKRLKWVKIQKVPLRLNGISFFPNQNVRSDKCQTPQKVRSHPNILNESTNC